VLAHRQSRDDLGVGVRGLRASLWILPAALGLSALSAFIAAKVGTLHPLYKANFKTHRRLHPLDHLPAIPLADYFMPRLPACFPPLNRSATPLPFAQRPFSSQRHICRTSRSPPPAWCGAPSPVPSSAVTKSVGARPGAGHSRTLLRNLHPRFAASSPPRRPGLPPLPRRPVRPTRALRVATARRPLALSLVHLRVLCG